MHLDLIVAPTSIGLCTVCKKLIVNVSRILLALPVLGDRPQWSEEGAPLKVFEPLEGSHGVPLGSIASLGAPIRPKRRFVAILDLRNCIDLMELRLDRNLYF